MTTLHRTPAHHEALDQPRGGSAPGRVGGDDQMTSLAKLTQHDRAALLEAAALIQDVQSRHPLQLSGPIITAASLAVHDIELFGRLLEETA